MCPHYPRAAAGPLGKVKNNNNKSHCLSQNAKAMRAKQLKANITTELFCTQPTDENYSNNFGKA